MKEYKLRTVNEMERLAVDYHSFFVRTAALAAGINHLKRQEVLEIVEEFKRRQPAYREYLYGEDPKRSVFTTLFVSDNETPPHEALDGR